MINKIKKILHMSNTFEEMIDDIYGHLCIINDRVSDLENKKSSNETITIRNENHATVSSIYKIDLNDYFWEDKTSLVGKDDANIIINNLKVKKIFFKDLENKHTEIQIIIPDNIVTISYTFFIELFGEPVLELGKDKFRNKYKFKTSKHIQDRIVEFIDRLIIYSNYNEADIDFFNLTEDSSCVSINKPLTERDRRYSYFIESVHKCMINLLDEMNPDALALCENTIRDMMLNSCKSEAIEFATKVMYMKANNKTDMNSDIPSIAYETIEHYYDKLYK